MCIPHRSPDQKFRTLVVLLDGTGDSVDDDVTNIVMLKNMLVGSDRPDSWDSDKQMVLYLRGIGSPMDGYDPSFGNEKALSWQSWIQRKWDQAFATSFGERVIIPYRWLAQNYREGDKICIFGFSRGAYTARVLAGMMNGLGLLPGEKCQESDDHVRQVYESYEKFAKIPHRDVDEAKRETVWLDLQRTWQTFKAENKCREPFIEFLGCWDTVNSVGIAHAIRLGFTKTNDIVRTFRHAIALDEHRVKFKQNNWSGPPEVPDSADRPKSKEPRVKTDVEEVWFAGCHCDIGGGSVPNGTRPNLAHISLRWMIRECFKTNTGMIFHSEEIRKIGVDPTSLYPLYKPRQISSAFVPIGSSQITVVEPQTWGAYFKSWIPFTSKPQKKVSELQVPTQSEDELDALDALAPAYDQLELNSSTWAWMEDFKMEREVRSKDGKFVPVFDKHLGHGRSIPPTRYQHGGKVKVHGTVRLRMAATLKNGAKMGTSYSPLARVGYEPQFEDKMPFEKAVEKGLIEWVV